MKKLILVTAGSTAWKSRQPTSDEPRIQGVIPLPLTDKDKEALACLAKNLSGESLDYLYSSGNESSGPTANYLAELWHLKHKKISELHELDCGLWQGLRIAEIKTRFGRSYRQWRKDPTTICPPQGETLDQAWERVGKALLDLSKKKSDQTILIVAARIISGVIECVLTGRPAARLWETVDEAECVRVFQWENSNELPFRGVEKISFENAEIQKVTPQRASLR